MKVETPEILWNTDESDEQGRKGVPAALMSVSLARSGTEGEHVLATAGNTKHINLWRITLEAADKEKPIFQRNHGLSAAENSTKMEYLCSLSRHDGPVNCVRFSPDGLHLATAGETGAVIVWSVPINKRGGGNGRHYWSSCVTREADLSVKIVPRCTGDGICDLSWSTDSKRFMAGTIDHAVLICEDASYTANHPPAPQPAPALPKDSEWRLVYRNGMEHTHYVQGVAYDPTGVYLASMSSDRTVRVWTRKQPAKSKGKKQKVLQSAASSQQPNKSPSAVVTEWLTDSKLELGHGRAKMLKYRKLPAPEMASVLEEPPKQRRKQYMFADESTLESFYRRLAFTCDGAFLVTPAALWAPAPDQQAEYATLLWARHRWDEPAKVLTGLEKVCIPERGKEGDTDMFLLMVIFCPFSRFRSLPLQFVPTRSSSSYLRRKRARRTSLPQRLATATDSPTVHSLLF
jgi:chromatin assembly factor 1 subunit B